MWFWNGVIVSLPSYALVQVRLRDRDRRARRWGDRSPSTRRSPARCTGRRRRTRSCPSRSGRRWWPRTWGRSCRCRSSGSGSGPCWRRCSTSTRKDPLKVLPPCFVTALMTPPVNRPNSAETPDVIVVVSWMASSMKRLVGVPRTLSWTLTPLTVKTLSNDWRAGDRDVRRSRSGSARAPGRPSRGWSGRSGACCVSRRSRSSRPGTSGRRTRSARRPSPRRRPTEIESFAFIGTDWLEETLTFLVTAWKPDMTKVMTYSPGGRFGRCSHRSRS